MAPSIAVLPLANLSAERENEYFGDGLAEEITNALAQVEGLKVIARTSAFSFKGKNEDIRNIALVLRVTNVLEGYDRPMTDVFAMQGRNFVKHHQCAPGQARRSAGEPRHYTPRLSAYETFLRGRAHLTQFTPDAWNRANGHFEQPRTAVTRPGRIPPTGPSARASVT